MPTQHGTSATDSNDPGAPTNEFEVLYYQNYTPLLEQNSSVKFDAKEKKALDIYGSKTVETVFVRSLNDPSLINKFKGDECTVMGRYRILRSILQRYVKVLLVDERPDNFSESASYLDNNAFVSVHLPDMTMPALIEILMRHGFHIATSHSATLDTGKLFIELILTNQQQHSLLDVPQSLSGSASSFHATNLQQQQQRKFSSQSGTDKRCSQLKL